jgi:selenocysteine-specific elongation factor
MIIGTAGHIDHGKTALIKAITGVDADRLKEEKARGITIELGFAYWPQDDGSVLGFVDVPGHERFVHTMLAGAGGIDLVLLVIAADDGIMPQTREHLEIISLLGLTRGIVALTKVDAAAPARVVQVEGEIAAWLAGTPLADAPILPVSARTGEGMPALITALQAEAARNEARAADRAFRLAIDRSFTLQGAGLVVTGLVMDGAVKVGDSVTISPAGHSARVRAIHAQNRKSETGVAGQRCALNLVGATITKESVTHGMMVLAPESHAPSARMDITLTIPATCPRPLTQWMPARLHHATAEIGARLVLLEEGEAAPGTRTRVQLVLDSPIAARAGDRVVLRDTSAAHTIGGGVILDLRPPARKRRTPERRAMLDALTAPTPEGALTRVLALGEAMRVDNFAQDHGLPLSRVSAWVEAGQGEVFSLPRATYALATGRITALAERIQTALAEYHAQNPDMAGMGQDRLRLATAPRLDAALFRLLLRRFIAAGWLKMDGNWLRLASHSVDLNGEDEALWAMIAPLLGGNARFRPPRVRDIAKLLAEDEAQIRRVMKRLARAGLVQELAQDHFFPTPVVAELVDLARAVELDAQGWFVAAAFRDRLEAISGEAVGRRVAIQILEALDKLGVTIRRGDNRRINPYRRDLFHGSEQEPEGREAPPVGRPDFKSGWGCEPVPGGFDSHSLPPSLREAGV